MDLKQIEYFLQLADLEHMSQTADMLDIAQPSLSRSIAGLERELGIRLFDRVGNHIRLNRNGEQFYRYARESMELLHTACLSARQSMYETVGSVRISCKCFSAILLPCIHDYMQLNPRVDMKLNQYNHEHDADTLGDSCDMILTSELDREGRGKNEFWIKQPLFSEDCRLVIGPKHPQFEELCRMGDTIDPGVLRDAQFITMDFGRGYQDITYGLCQKAGFFPRAMFRTDDFTAKMYALREGMGVAFLPESCLEEAGYACPGLRHFGMEGMRSRRTVVLLRKKENLLSETAMDFWDFAVDYFGAAQEGEA